MKIIQAHKYYYLRSGVGRYLLDVSKRLEEQGHEIIPFAMVHQNNLPTPYARFFVSQVETERTRFDWQGLRTFGRMLYSFEAKKKMKALVKEVHPDLCHVHNLYGQISPSILDTLHEEKVPVVMTVHDHHLVSPAYNVWAEGCGPQEVSSGIIRATFSRFHKDSLAASFAQVLAFRLHRMLGIYERNVDLFLCPSVYMSRRLITAGFPSQKVRVLHNPVDTQTIQPSYDHHGYFLFVGRLSSEKGCTTILRLARLLPEIPFKIVGNGPQQDFLERKGRELANVEFLGFRMGDTLQELYHGAIAVLIPSRVQDNFPFTALEAHASGKPVVGSDVGGMGEIVQDRVTGFLVKPLDLHGWSEAILRLYYDEDLQKRLSLAARERVERLFTIRAHNEQLMRLYEEAMRMHHT
ncbi:MAG: glycosyltransferase family 4 protein [Patescibacteria group bacterium]